MQTGGFTHDFPIFAVGARIARPRRVSGAPSPIVQAKASPNARRALGEVAWRSHDGGVAVGAAISRPQTGDFRTPAAYAPGRDLAVGARTARPLGCIARVPAVVRPASGGFGPMWASAPTEWLQ